MKIYYYITVVALFLSLSSFAVEMRQIEHAIQDVNNNVYKGIDSMLIFKNNRLISEQYFNGYDQEKLHQTRSTFKSVIGLLAAIALDKDILSLNEPILPLIAQYLKINNEYPKKAQISVKDLLNMTSGLHCSEMPGTGPYHDVVVDEGPEPLKYSLSIAMAIAPGSEWKYCNANTFLLGVTISAALKRAQQHNISEFAAKSLFEPLDISEYRIYQSPDGFLYAQGNARFKPRDLAKFGLLVLNQGKWQGKQIISNQHINSILAGVVETHWSWVDLIGKHSASKARYAFQWFQTVFELDGEEIPVSHTWGNGGQFVFVIPSLNTVVVFTGSNYGNIELQKQPFEIMHKYLLPALMH